ncbi:MAG: YgiT-type zinc finger protein [Chloroflexi bacterium]|nr:MAG: hypothetical protein CUN54_08250 [Phototrophicales bacterium]RMF77448.1 MAG: YgiT-type zinc finger protein [Chloroflexota bacterium]
MNARSANKACPYCHIGQLKSGDVNFIRLHGDAVVMTPHMPALTCDICGYREFDAAALQHLERLLDEAGPIAPRPQSQQKKQSLTEKSDTNTTRRVKR